MIKNYLFNVLVGFDQFLNTVLAGWADETLSSRAHRVHQQGKPWGFLRNIINLLFWWQDDHCLLAYNYEKSRRQLPPELRE